MLLLLCCACAQTPSRPLLLLAQVLSVSSSSGLFACYLAALPAVFAAHGTRVASLSSLGEVAVTDVVSRARTTVAVDCEPALCSLGPHHLAVGINNQVRVVHAETDAAWPLPQQH